MRLDDFIISDMIFDNAMHEIDAELRAESPIFRGREFRGWGKFCVKFDLDEVPMNHPLTQRIFAWFQSMYGDRLNINFDLGKTVINLNGDLYPIRCIRCYGTVDVICSSAMMGKDLGPRMRTGGTHPILNVLDVIPDLTRTMANRLTTEQCKAILDTYSNAFLTFLALESAFGQKHIKEAIDDCQMAIDNLFYRVPNYGMSRYSSLQAAEKTLKSFIHSKGETPRYKHDLSSLAKRAYELGLPELETSRIADVQCDANTRYNAAASTKDQALSAHYSSFDLIRKILPHQAYR